jgi:pseudouridine synthase
MDYTYIVCYKPALTLCTLQADLDRIHHKDHRIRPTLADLSLPIHDVDNHNRSSSSIRDDDDDDDEKRRHKLYTTTTTATTITTSDGGGKEDQCSPGNESQQQQDLLQQDLQQQQHIQPQRPPLHIVGRLDRHSEGLLLLTNDGQFTARVLSPPRNKNDKNNHHNNCGCTKRYWALVESMYSTKTRTRYQGGAAAATPTSVDSALQEMRAGGLSIRGSVTLPPRSVRIIPQDEIQAMGLVPALQPPVAPAAIVVGLDQSPPTTTTTTAACSDDNGSGRESGLDETRRHSMWLEFVLQEGKNRQVRRITADAGYKTLRLVRVAIGALELQRCRRSDMKSGGGGGSEDKQQPQQQLQESHQLQLQPGQWMYIDKSDVLGGKDL